MNGVEIPNNLQKYNPDERVIGSAENLVGRVLQEQGLGRYCDPEFVKATQRELAEAINLSPKSWTAPPTASCRPPSAAAATPTCTSPLKCQTTTTSRAYGTSGPAPSRTTTTAGTTSTSATRASSRASYSSAFFFLCREQFSSL
ncbi:CAC1F_C domain-containing protein [Caerostris extrusa]|uniref:CAC1F_C domain-containing protein n=1 Tax=Caerostris extrusa TaxID=172846 RepID=A0AAV4V1V8_CAEEX|nr:CAC1F_C domain-containing protein [Caerostris extrusa]